MLATSYIYRRSNHLPGVTVLRSRHQAVSWAEVRKSLISRTVGCDTHRVRVVSTDLRGALFDTSLTMTLQKFRGREVVYDTSARALQELKGPLMVWLES